MSSNLSLREQKLAEIQQVVDDCKAQKVLQLYTQDRQLDGKTVVIDGQRLHNFFSCSYLGLELNPQMIEEAVKSVRNFGTTMSASRSYVSLGLYEELESLLGQIFESNVVISASTTLGHMNNIPLLVGDRDCVLYDTQVHASVQNNLNHVRVRGVKTFPVPHNDMAVLEQKILQLKDKYSRIWYMADGVYSMFGDTAPAAELSALSAKYEQLYLYIDDAHGMSWAGKHGRGYYLGATDLDEKTVVVTSLAKAFGVTGGVTIARSKMLTQLLRDCGQSLIFSGPLIPAALGAAIESAKLHLSEDFGLLQAGLTQRINLVNDLAKKFKLPVFFDTSAPICFVGVGKKAVGLKMIRRLFDDHFLVNAAMYPAVSLKNSGIRFTVTLHQNERMIHQLMKSIAHNLELSLMEEGETPESLQKDFKRLTQKPNYQH